MIVFEGGEGGAEEVGEEAVAELGGGAPLAAVAAGELDEGVADGGQEGEGGRKVAELLGALAVLEGVEVALRGAGAGASAAPSTGLRAGSGHGSLLLIRSGFGTGKRMGQGRALRLRLYDRTGVQVVE